MDPEPPFLRRARTMGDSTHFRFETRSYRRPMYEDDFEDHDDNDARSTPRRPSLFRTAFSLIGAVNEARREQRATQQRSTDPRAKQPRSRPAAPESSRSQARTQSREYQDTGRDARSSRRSTREQSPPTQSSGRQRRGEAASYFEVEHEGDDYERSPRGSRLQRPKQSSADYRHIRSLELDVQYEQDEVDDCSEWLSRYAHWENTSERLIEKMVARLQTHKQALKDAKAALEDELDRIQMEPEPKSRPRRPRRRHTTQDSERSMPQGAPPGLDNIFNVLFGAAMPSMDTRNGQMPNDAFAAHSALFNHLFAQMAADHHFVFTTSQGPQPQDFSDFFNANMNGQGFRSQAMPNFAQAAPRQAKPKNILTIKEAKSLYEVYNNKWSSLTASDPNIPYPGRKLQAAAVVARDAIWAPSVAAPVSTWSTENVIRFNTQTFFLAVADFSPSYTDTASKVEMTFDHTRADPAQLQLLADVLKKEKLRWHSDRLGRRNGAEDGLNEALQTNEITRGIFHAICELSELVTSKRQGGL